MPYCPSCGQFVGADARFCQSCGRPLTSVAPAAASVAAVSNAGTYSIVLASLGTCTKTAARSLLCDLLAYTQADARRITDAVPVEIAEGLNASQATAVAQIMNEYGMEVSVLNGRTYVDLSDRVTRSAFSSTGEVLTDIAAVLATLTGANRVRNILRWAFDDPYRYRLVPKYTRAPRRYELNPYRRLAPRPAPPRVVPKAPARPPRAVGPAVPPPPGMAPRPSGVKTPRPSGPARLPRPAGPVGPAGPGGRGRGGRGPGGRGPGM